LTNFVKRSLTGGVFVAIVAAGILIHPYLFAVIFAAFIVLIQSEFYGLAKQAGLNPQSIFGQIIGVTLFVLLFSYAAGLLPSKTIYMVIPLFFTTVIFELFRKKDKPLENIAVSLLGNVYIAFPISLLNFLVFPGLPDDQRFYPWLLMGVFFIIWTYDTSAFIFGIWLGKHRLFERISPKKSWEGLIGGSMMALIAGIINSLLFQPIEMANWIAISIIIIVFGTFGDLIESMIKRSLNIKDSGHILPGHGGLLDRFDSLLICVPFILAWLMFFNN